MSDGLRLRQSWNAALSNVEAQFRSLLVSSGSSAWKRVPSPPSSAQSKPGQSTSPNGKGKGRFHHAEGISIHRRQTKRGDILRIVLDVPAAEGPLVDLDKWRAVLSTPEIRGDWDPAVEGSSLVEMFDWNTRITRTNYALGWPANPRDSVTISKTLYDATTLIDISTSLPRSLDEPAYLRPAPPFVRSHVHLLAWCIQILPTQLPNGEGLSNTSPLADSSKLRVTCFWQHDLKAVWNLSSALSQQLPTMVQGLLRVVQKRGQRIPLLCAYGTGVTLERVVFEVGREALSVEYAIVHEEEDESSAHAVKALEQVNEAKERKRLERSVECILPDSIGWDIQISTRASSEVVANLPWKATANRTSGTAGLGHTTFRVHHSSLPDIQAILKVKMVIELSGGASGLRLNGLPHPVLEVEPRDPTSFTLSHQMLQDTSSVSGLSFQSLSTGESSGDVSSSSTTPRRVLSRHGGPSRTTAAEKVILTRVKRNYIYFSSLLQEPEAKWKRNSEARGVTVTQLDSIDPTLVVYRAEAVFVGVSLWDLYSAIASPGARVYWDKGHEDAVLLEDVNELTELWHWQTKPNWPANARDVVLLKTVYKSPTTVHVFSFSTDDTQLFSSIPPTDPNIIRTQVDLQGWAIETLSPTTTHLMLLEQSDPRGWAGKSSIPQQMINAVAGVGGFAIKYGGPPVNTRLGGARSLSARYDHEKGTFRLEYEGCEGRRSGTGSADFTVNGNRNASFDLTSPSPSPTSPDPVTSLVGPTTLPYIECELRCDLDAWTSSLEVVIDPPPQTVSCLRRHRLSSGGGGLWLTIGHDAVFAGEDRLLVMVRKGTSKEKGGVVVNGAKIKVDVEEISESEVKTLTKMKRVKPMRVPLDQPPVLGVIRRRHQEWNEESDSDNSGTGSGVVASSGVMRWATSAPKFSSPLAQFWTRAVEQTAATTSAAVSVASATLGAGTVTDSPPSSSKPPMTYALSALAFLQSLHINDSADGWTLVNDKGFPVHRKLHPEVSNAIPVHKGEKVIEGVSAEEVAHIVNNYDSRAAWDDRFDSAVILQEFGAGCHTAFLVAKGGFPFRDRGFYLASITARVFKVSDSPPSERQHSGSSSPHSHSTTILCASASFSPSSVDSFDVAKYNPHGLPIGRIMIQGWILETLDPYTTENYAIPSTKCTYVVSVDYAGSVPVAFNSLLNAALPRTLLAIEQHIKGRPALPVMRLPSSGLALLPENDGACVGGFESTDSAWKIEPRDDSRTLISSRYHTSSKKFRGTILVSLNLRIPDVMTPRPSTSATPLPDVIVHSEGPTTPMSSPAASPASTIRKRRISAASSTLQHSRSLSRDRVHAAAVSNSIPVDFLVGELVVDSKLYPDGYEVRIASHLRDAKDIGHPLSMSPISSASSDLPISCTCHVLPSTPLHSSGLNINSPPRHLLRFTLPTARYEVLADEPLLIQPPARPKWLMDFEANGSIVEIVVFPSAGGGQKGKGLVVVDGSTMEITGEKESIRLLRRELEDDRLSKMPILSKISLIAGIDAVPQVFTEPIAVATTLYDSTVLVDKFTTTGTTTGTIEDKTDSDRELSPGDDAHSEATDSVRTPLEHADAIAGSSSGLLGFLNGYPNSLFRRGSRTLDFSAKSHPPSVHGSSSMNHNCSSTPTLVVKTNAIDARLYPLSTVLIIGLISFLFGSLLRSLLTPADFIYVSRDLSELENGHDGWREIKRLVELKYAIGGWDLLIGMVRRH
ncbi:hypothetical protein K439DRAFT_1395236 [Ramaria rubella]|nr:hypothetical protein K439DRAFT_1395236 [Ramaria rubella]